MSETTADPSASAGGSEAPGAQTAAALEEVQITIRSMLEAGVHFGHQTRRWNPRMRSFIFGERDGIHILDLDQSLPRFQAALDFLRDVASEGGKVLLVGTKRQAAPIVEFEARRAGQFYVNNRWLGGMLTNWKTVKKSIDRYKELLEILDDQEKLEEFSKKELARVNRQCVKYAKSLEGIKEMSRLPDAMFVVDVGREQIAVSEARRLGIPIIAVVDSNCNPEGIDFVIPGNDDSIRAVGLYCKAVAQACIDGNAIHQEKLRSETKPQSEAEAAAAPVVTGRRVVEIRQPPRRGRGAGSGRVRSYGGRAGGREQETAAAASEEVAAGQAAAPEEGAPAPPAASQTSGDTAPPAPEASAPAETEAAASESAPPEPESSGS
jgi:small subunit ribosomal protein S2